MKVDSSFLVENTVIKASFSNLIIGNSHQYMNWPKSLLLFLFTKILQRLSTYEKIYIVDLDFSSAAFHHLLSLYHISSSNIVFYTSWNDFETMLTTLPPYSATKLPSLCIISSLTELLLTCSTSSSTYSFTYAILEKLTLLQSQYSMQLYTILQSTLHSQEEVAAIKSYPAAFTAILQLDPTSIFIQSSQLVDNYSQNESVRVAAEVQTIRLGGNNKGQEKMEVLVWMESTSYYHSIASKQPQTQQVQQGKSNNKLANEDEDEDEEDEHDDEDKEEDEEDMMMAANKLSAASAKALQKQKQQQLSSAAISYPLLIPLSYLQSSSSSSASTAVAHQQLQQSAELTSASSQQPQQLQQQSAANNSKQQPNKTLMVTYNKNDPDYLEDDLEDDPDADLDL